MRGAPEGYVVVPGVVPGGVGDLWRRRGLLFSLLLREAQVRYRQAVLGVLWALLQPLALAAVATLVFHRVLAVDPGGVPYPLFAFVGLVPWTFFHTAVSYAVPSLVANADLVRKIYFPRAALPLAAGGAVLLDLCAGSVLAAVWLALHGSPATPALLWVVPLLLVLLATTAGLGLLGAAINVRYRDVKHALPLVLQTLFLATPVVYSLDAVPPAARAWLSLNPLAGVVEGLRSVLLHGHPPAPATLLPGAAASLLLLLLAWGVFRRAERTFADEV